MEKNLRCKSLILSLITVIIMVVAAGCSSSRRSAGSTADYGSMSLQQRFDALAAQNGEWTELSVPVKVELVSPSSFSISGRAYFRKGESIYVSLRFLGMEVANMYLTGDSAFVCDKVNRRYVAEEISGIFNGASFSVSDIQDMMLGRAFVNGDGTLSRSSASKVTLGGGADSWTITPKKKIAGIEYRFDVTTGDNTLKSLSARVKGHEVVCNYSGRSETAAGVFMSTAEATVPHGDKVFKARLKWSFGSMKQQVDQSVKWKYPSGYTRVTTAQLLKIFSAFK